MKPWRLFFTIFFLSLSVTIHAAEYRFEHKETTGLTDFVHSSHGAATAIKFTTDSAPEALALLEALMQHQIYGTKSVQQHRGTKWEQKIVLLGEFTSPKKQTPSGRTTAESESYRDFRITGLKVHFPISRFVSANSSNVPPEVLMETHFNFASLFPKGFSFKGKPLELEKYQIYK
jgi:hypothetical protein